MLTGTDVVQAPESAPLDASVSKGEVEKKVFYSIAFT